MKITFSQHALYQLHERNLTTREVENALHKPDRHIPQTFRRWRAVRIVTRQRKRYCLVVIYDRTNSHAEIVTAFLTSKLTKYL